MRYTPHRYQFHALRWLIQRTIVDGKGGGAYFLDPGLGKTSITLAWIRLLRMFGVEKVLVVAPLRVVYNVWRQEASKWDQFSHLRVAVVHGDGPQERIAAIEQDADIYLINPEGLPWLKDYLAGGPMPFGALVVDESSKFKSWGAKRTRILRKMVPQFRFRLILTGTPSPNSVEDLFSQMFIADEGESLGKTITPFRNRFFHRGGYNGYKWLPNENAMSMVESLIKDSCLRLSAEDHLDLPEMLINDVWVELPDGVREGYRKLEREMFLEIGDGNELVASNAGAKYGMCRQVANGGLYDGDGGWSDVHSSKIEAARDLVEELQGKPALIAFPFRHDLERLRGEFGKKEVPAIYGKTSNTAANRLIDKWNAGELPVLAVQPDSLSHGVNMQAGPGRDVIWLGLTDNLETYDQFNKRIHRQGVKGDVRIHRILARRTVDEAIRLRLESKSNSQQALLAALNDYGGQG